MRYLISSVQDLWRAWDRFWFAPQHPATLGLLRIIGGGMILYTHLVWTLRLEEFFGPSGWQDALDVGTFQREALAPSFWWLVPDAWRFAAHYVCLVILGCFMLGVFTRLTSLLTLAIVVSYANRVPMATFGLDQINTLLAIYLAIGPSGACYSLDRLWRRYRDARTATSAGLETWHRPEPPRATVSLATRLVQVNLCVIYLIAGMSKLKGTSWWDGNAIWLGAANFEYQSGDLTWLAWHPWLYNFLTHTTIFWELTFSVFVWHPRFRPLVLLAGIGMHLGIGMFLGMWTFGLVMIFAYLAFVRPETTLGIERWILSLVGPGNVAVTYGDGFVSRRWAAVRCALSPGEPARLVRRARESIVPALPVTAGAWWRAARASLVAQWPFPSLRTTSGEPLGDLLVVSSRVSTLARTQETFQRHGCNCRAVADVPGACVALSDKPCQCLVLFVHQAGELEDVRLLREMSISGGAEAPATVVVLKKELMDQVDWAGRRDHRLIFFPVNMRELHEELDVAWQFRSPPIDGDGQRAAATAPRSKTENACSCEPDIPVAARKSS